MGGHRMVDLGAVNSGRDDREGTAMFAEIQWETGIEEAFTDVATFVPKLLAAFAILFVGWIVARVIRGVVYGVLDRVGLDDIMNRSGIPDALGRPIDGAQLAATLLFYIVMLSVLKVASSAFGENAIGDSLDGLIAFLPRLVVALAIVVLAGLVAGKLGELVSNALEGRAEQRIMTTIASVAVWVVGGFAAVDHIGVAPDIVDTLFQTLVVSVAAIAVIKFGVGGIWAARDRFWPNVYDRISGPVDGSGDIDLTQEPAEDPRTEAHGSDVHAHR